MGALLQVENLTKSFGYDLLFGDISFGLDEGDKVGLIAKNGTGKSTLLNLLARVDTPDSGSIIYRNNLRIGYLPQIPTFEGAKTVLDVCLEGEDAASRAVRAYESAMTTGDAEAMTAAIQAMDNSHAWDYEERFKQILTQLKIDNYHQPVGELSGGQVKRVALAKILIDEPQFLILD
ncbi:MAG: ABC-F family ATP-binding cassette domain-containing protein, partial [Muribaculaceae bacterium]|nr:ABC-F family ATP-binding cassette domain-containing protein [Muribaculaceae bacterium]